MLAQLDRASGYGPEGQGFESLTACQIPQSYRLWDFSCFFAYLSRFLCAKKRVFIRIAMPSMTLLNANKRHFYERFFRGSAVRGQSEPIFVMLLNSFSFCGTAVFEGVHAFPSLPKSFISSQVRFLIASCTIVQNA